MLQTKICWIASSIAVLISLSSNCFICSARAQWKYSQINKPLDPKLEKVALDYNKGTSKDSGAGTNAIKECCQAYIARFTVPYDQSLPKFENVRRKLDQYLGEGAPKQPLDARAALVSTLVEEAGKVAAGSEFSPAARVNCALILGELDEARDTIKNSRKPSAAARDKLLQLLANDTTPIYLKAVALQGLERHAQESDNGWSDDVKKKVNQIAMQYASAKPALDADRQANTWLTRRSLELLRIIKSRSAIDIALAYLGDPGELHGLRFTALQYLLFQDVKSMSAEQKKAYVLGIAHLLRSELVRWYYTENDRQKRKSAGPMGDGGMGMGPGGMGPGGGFGSGDDFGGGDGGDLGMGGLGPGGFGSGDFGPGGFGPGGGRGTEGRGSGRKPIDSQTWEARMARRQLNQLTQYVRLALEGKQIESDTKVKVASYLNQPDAGLSREYNLPRLIELVNNLQSIINNRDRISTVQSLMRQTKKEIETTMRFVKGLPGFLDKYPELRGGDEELQSVEEPSGDSSSDPPASSSDDGGGDAGANAGGNNAGGNAGAGGQPPGNN